MIFAATLAGVARVRRVWRVLPLTALAVVSGCFATRNDVRIVQSDLVALRTELLKNDADQKATLARAMTVLAAATDSLARISARTVSIQGDVRGEMRAVKEQLLQVQTLLGQSQANLTRLRATIEANSNAAPPAPVAPPTGTTPATPSAGTSGGAPTTPPAVDTTTPRGPGPTQLYQNGLDLMRRGSTSTARTVFQELLSTYPTSEFAPDAQYYTAESLRTDKNWAGADAAFAAVVTKYPDSPRAPTSHFKRAQIALQQGNTADARKLFTEVVSRFPKSPEAELAAEQLRLIK
ncbi:MAG: tol-pal system protein YbgF [Gemmatimonadaceae bacterium]|nr:tol-pal system protein YbgF [Gemmatimonadaceae bacterium]